MIWARIVLKILVMTVVMIMVKIMVKMTTMMMMTMVMTRGSGDIRAHLRPKNETNGPRAVTVGGGSRVLHCVIVSYIVLQCVTVCFTVFLSVTLCHTVYFTVRLYAGHSGRRIWAVDTKVISRQCQPNIISVPTPRIIIIMIIITITIISAQNYQQKLSN